MIKACLSTFFCIVSLIAFSQETKFEEKNDFKYDTSYVKVFSKYISLENSLSRNGLNLLILEKNSGKIRYSVNQKVQLGYRINWRFINLGFAINIPILNNDDEKFGETSGFNLNFTSQIKRKVVLDIFFLFQKGLYVVSAPSIIPNFDRSGNYPAFKSMVVDYLGVDANYIFNHKKFTFKAPLNINERQLKSSGSLFVGGYFFFSQVLNESGLLNDSLTADFNYLLQTSEMNSINFGVTAGYGHNFVIKKHGLISTTGYFGIGPGISNKTDIDGNTNNKLILSGRYKLRVMGAYMNDNISVGARFLVSVLPNSANDNLSVNYETDYASFFFSYRFLPLITQNKMKKLEKAY